MENTSHVINASGITKESILVVDDDADISELIRYNLAREGYHVINAASGEEALKIIRRTRPDMILLDIMLPGMDGLDVCRILRSESSTRSIPLIMLSARGEEVDVVTGLELGADDYLAKPFSPRVLSVRIKAVLRRNRSTPVDKEASIHVEGLWIDPRRHEATIDGKFVMLTPTEFNLLHFLARNLGVVFTRNQIVDAVHGEDYPVTDRSIDVQIVGLRRKLGSKGDLIETVRGVGYRFKG